MSLSIDVSNGPTGSLASAVCDSSYSDESDGCLTGEKLNLQHLKPNDGFKVIDITVVDMPDYEDRDDDVYGDISSNMIVRLTADSLKHDLTAASGSPGARELKEKLTKWLMTKEDSEEFDEEYLKLLDYEVTNNSTQETTKEIKANVLFDPYEVIGDVGNIISSPFFDEFWNIHMNKIVTEGVCYSSNKVPSNLRDSLRINLDKLAEETPIDYHPNSKDIVRDLVHPALCPYVEGVSRFKNGKSKSDIATPEQYSEHDFWGRKYENSKFQWLPTQFLISEEGKCSIQEYINNLNREKFPELYTDLEKLFEVFLPYFQEVWSYAKAMKFWNSQTEEDLGDNGDDLKFEKEEVNFKGRELQVITKIVEYKLKPDQSYEGVWHAEGMSHENIVMTGIYFIDRDADLSGGDLRFKRSFHISERNKLYFNLPQMRSLVLNQFAVDGVLPLGHFPTDQGYMLVFPNCHIHKIAKLINTSLSNDARRRIVVFFVINPEKRIISTREIEPQQEKRAFSLARAKQFRLDLMAERKYDKEKLNVRDIELCEH